jgi:hypothetical protein
VEGPQSCGVLQLLYRTACCDWRQPSAHRAALSALTSVIPVSQIVYGTDFPFRTNEDHVRGLSAFFDLMDMKAIDRDNALRFIPRLKTA